jgi:hypothetical protein
MKKIILIASLLLSYVGFSFAQNTKPAEKTKSATASTTAKPSTTAGPTKKDGSADKR